MVLARAFTQLSQRGAVFSKITTLVAVCLCFSLLSCADSVQADSRIDPKLEAQVLQIIREHPEAILESLQQYQQAQQAKQQQARRDFLTQMQTTPRQIIGQSPTKGATAQTIVLVEFSDFQCPYCARASATIHAFMAKHGDEVTFVYKHFPLTSIHDQALPAAKAAWAAQQQGKFWEFHDALFAEQDQLGEDLYRAIAQRLNLNLAQFDRDRARAAAALQPDLDLAESLGLSGTPVLFMNGEVLTGAVAVADLEAVLERVRATVAK
ncbi:DsbA family protein [Trichothermofontia sp.]